MYAQSHSICIESKPPTFAGLQLYVQVGIYKEGAVKHILFNVTWKKIRATKDWA